MKTTENFNGTVLLTKEAVDVAMNCIVNVESIPEQDLSELVSETLRISSDMMADNVDVNTALFNRLRATKA